MFTRNGMDILTFRVYDGYGNCIDEFTGTMQEWHVHVAEDFPKSVKIDARQSDFMN